MFFVVLSLTLGLCVPVLAGPKKLKLTKPKHNPAAYGAFSKVLPETDRFQHAVNRLTFGPRAGDLDRLQQLGLASWIDLQLHPEQIPENPVLLQHLEPLTALSMTPQEAFFAYPPKAFVGVGNINLALLAANEKKQGPRVVATELTQAKLLRAVYSNRQLEELLVDFWYNHFNVSVDKGGDRYLALSYERDAIRPHVLGKFYDLLLATAESPAMLFYLDNWQSVSPALPQRPDQKKKRGLNENYGRELLELHTLGVDGGYTQQDVIEVARCFTGWTISNPRQGGSFEYNDKVHDKGQKIVLGHVIPAGGGMNDGLQVLAILARHPATARFISLNLAQRFVADDPPPSLVDRMAQTFEKTGGDLCEVMRTMLYSTEFWSQGAYRAKLKTPFELVASSLRATNADVQSAIALSNQLQKLGEPLYRKLEPTGYSNMNAEWISSAALLDRMNFAVALAHDHIPGVAVRSADWQTLGSPEFQRK